MPEKVVRQYNDMEGVHPPKAGPERPKNPAVHTFAGISEGWETLDVGDRLNRVESVAVQFATVDETGTPTTDGAVVLGYVVLGRPVRVDVNETPITWDYFAPLDLSTKELHHAKGIYKVSLYCRYPYAYTVWIAGDDTKLPD